MKYLERRLIRKVRKYLQSVSYYNKAERERLRYIVKISGVTLDDLDTPPREIPFEREVYKATEEEAIEIGKAEHLLGNKVEIWHLLKRF